MAGPSTRRPTPTRAPSAIRLVVVDDHPVVCSGLRELLAPYEDIIVVGEAASGEESVPLCREVRPDVVFMDLALPDMDGFEATRLIRAACPGVQVVALTGFQGDDLVRRALEAGMIGYLLKSGRTEELARAVRAAAGGEPVFSLEATKSLFRLVSQPETSKAPLTNREDQIVALMIAGLTNREIGAALALSPSTVKSHLRQIFSKVGASNRTQAAVQALQRHQDARRAYWASLAQRDSV